MFLCVLFLCQIDTKFVDRMIFVIPTPCRHSNRLFFSAHVDLLDSILAIVKGGKHLQQIVKLTLQQVSTLLDEADHGVYVVLASGMPISQYQKMSSFNLVILASGKED